MADYPQSRIRKGLYKVTFRDPNHEAWATCPRCGTAVANDAAKFCHNCGQARLTDGSYLDVSHGAGYPAEPPMPLAIKSGEPYVGPLSDDDLAYLQGLADGSAAKSLSYPANWEVKVETAQVQ
jgi:hypothetical protein